MNNINKQPLEEIVLGLLNQGELTQEFFESAGLSLVNQIRNIYPQNSVGFKLKPAGIDTEICVDKKSVGILIPKLRIPLLYDESKLEENLDQYIFEQLNVHQMYKEFIKRILPIFYRDLHSKVESENRIKRGLQLVSETAAKRTLNLAKIIFRFFSFIGFDYKSELARDIQKYQRDMVCYSTINSIISVGKHIFEKYLEEKGNRLSVESKSQLQECINIARDLTYLYLNLIRTANNNVRHYQRLSDLYYPVK